MARAQPEEAPSETGVGIVHDGAEKPEKVPAFKVVDVVDVTIDPPASYGLVTLIESEFPGRHLEIPLGIPETNALAFAFHDVTTARPLTHALFAHALRALSTDIVAVRITGRHLGNYVAELVLVGPRGQQTLPCRPSDGLTLALRQRVRAPILVDERLLLSDDDVRPGPGD